MQRIVDRLLRLIVVAINLVAWVPWLVYALIALTFPAPWMPLTIVLPIFGVAVATICARAKSHWELRTLVPLAPLLGWAVYLMLNVLFRPVHQATDCALCSLIHIRVVAAKFSLEQGNYFMAFNLLWWDLLLPLAVFITALLLVFINVRRLSSGLSGAQANAI